MSDREAVAALVSDLHWQLDQLAVRGIKDAAGNPYNPSHFKRGLSSAVAQGGDAVPDFLRAYLAKPPNDGFKKLEAADSLDLACEALVLDAEKPYAHLFDEAARARAAKRLAPYEAAIDARRTAQSTRIEKRAATLPDDLEALRVLAEAEDAPEDAVAVNTAILRQDEEDVVACLRLGRAHEALGEWAEAVEAFERALAIAPGNAIAQRRHKEAARQLVRRAAR